MKIGLIDNYDSFSYLLLRLIEDSLSASVVLQKNDQLDYGVLSECAALILSPGPGLPEQAGQLMEAISIFSNKIPILGVCLGHQALGVHFGCGLKRLPKVAHGYCSSLILNDSTTLFRGFESDELVGRYHSWVIEPQTISGNILITARDVEGNIMGIRHRSLPLEGVQFHPESVMTNCGTNILQNFKRAYL